MEKRQLQHQLVFARLAFRRHGNDFVFSALWHCLANVLDYVFGHFQWSFDVNHSQDHYLGTPDGIRDRAENRAWHVAVVDDFHGSRDEHKRLYAYRRGYANWCVAPIMLVTGFVTLHPTITVGYKRSVKPVINQWIGEI